MDLLRYFAFVVLASGAASQECSPSSPCASGCCGRYHVPGTSTTCWNLPTELETSACRVSDFCGLDSDCKDGEVCVGVDNGGQFGSWGNCQTRGACEDGWTYLVATGSCYKFMATTASAVEAVHECAKLGAKVTTAKSPEEIKFLHTIGSHNTWLGLSDAAEEGSWLWSDGKELTWSQWNNGEGAFTRHGSGVHPPGPVIPDNGNGNGEENCAVMMYGTWEDEQCTGGNYNYEYICKK